MSSEARAALVFLAPALLLIFLFFFAPVVAGFALSLTDFDLYSIGDIHNLRFVGLHNYRELVGSSIFWQAFYNTLVFAVAGGPLTVIASLVSALFVNAKLTRGKAAFRTIYFAPVVTTLVAVSIVFKYLYHPRFGVINRALGVVGVPAIDWLGDPHWALFSIIILAIWRQFGYSMIIFIAGLQTIPDELYEAARIDGANAWRLFWRITYPLLKPIFLVLLLLSIIWDFGVFTQAYLVTGELGNRDEYNLGIYAYDRAFTMPPSYGVGSALALILTVILLIITIGYVRASVRQGAVE
jgi:multiple sugar transport system permease protein